MSNLYTIGAVSWHLPRYEGVAKEAAKANPKPYVVVTSPPAGEGLMSWGFDTRREALERYTSIVMFPNKDGLAYVAVFDKVNPSDPANPEDPFNSTMFGVSTTTTRQSAAGWILGGVASLFGLMVLSKKGKR